jgi:hypothetical protein
MQVGGQHYALAALPSGKRPGTHCTGDWVVPRPIWTGAENLASTGIRTPDRPARSKSLWRLRYVGPLVEVFIWNSYVSRSDECARSYFVI